MKIIHYCWFGRNPKPALITKCIESWKKYCPDYDIIEWNEDNFDVNCCDYVREAYEAKKWAFVSDYCRFYVLYHNGGIYMDTDVELLKSLNDLGSTFVGFETSDHCNSGLVRGAEKGDKVCKLMLNSYHEDHFKKEDGQLNLMTVCERETDILSKYGLKKNNTLQSILGTIIYPTEYFNPIDFETGKFHTTKNSVSIHHYAASWESKKSLFRRNVYRIINRCFGKKVAKKIRGLFGRSI